MSTKANAYGITGNYYYMESYVVTYIMWTLAI